MTSRIEDINAVAEAGLDMEVEDKVERLLSGMCNGELAERITDTVRLAVARHMYERARDVQSAVEAENSTQ